MVGFGGPHIVFYERLSEKFGRCFLENVLHLWGQHGPGGAVAQFHEEGAAQDVVAVVNDKIGLKALNLGIDFVHLFL